MRVRALALLAASVGLLGATARHNHLVKSSPSNGDSLQVAPSEIHLWFAERPELAFTSITLTDADSARIAVGKAKAGKDSLEAVVPLSAPLDPGSYSATWRSASLDGHAVRGSFRFTISGRN
jgi:methionine-rich copper-binding protein CopC